MLDLAHSRGECFNVSDLPKAGTSLSSNQSTRAYLCQDAGTTFIGRDPKPGFSLHNRRERPGKSDYLSFQAQQSRRRGKPSAPSITFVLHEVPSPPGSVSDKGDGHVKQASTRLNSISAIPQSPPIRPLTTRSFCSLIPHFLTCLSRQICSCWNSEINRAYTQNASYHTS